MAMQYWDNHGIEIAEIGRVHYANADGFDGAYRVRGCAGVAWRVFGWEVESTEDTEWDGILVRTGALVCVMIGDDRPEIVEPDELVSIDREEFCGECGQIGCCHDALDRD